MSSDQPTAPMPTSEADQPTRPMHRAPKPPPGQPNVIEVRNLVTHYGTRKIHDDISFDVAPGEIMMIIGGSGSGKSTLLKHMIGLLKPTSGSISYWGRDICRATDEQYQSVLHRIGVAFQSGGLFNSMTLGENIAMPMRERGELDDVTIEEIVEMKLGMVGLAQFENLLPSELSGGMKKRAGFARAIALDPEVVFIDEPSSGLDPITAAGLDELLRDLAKALGLTMIIVTHELASIRLVADRVLMLDLGKAIFYGTIEEALASPEPRVQQFFQRRADASITTRV